MVNSIDEFENWVKMKTMSVSSLPEKLKGVYILIDNDVIKYRKGDSNILYIGRTDNFMRRMFGNYIGNIGGKTTQRIHRLLFEKEYIKRVTIGFKICDEIKTEEKRLLHQFIKRYGEKPIWNKR